jgi:tRNA1(Val) A37 N6-methylase TrmN6
MDPDAQTTHGSLLGGRISFEQPARGYRAAIDPVLLAAAIPGGASDAVEFGAGAGAATLCLAARCAGLSIRAVEIDPAMAALARRNLAANGFTQRIEVIEGDLTACAPAMRGSADVVYFNPPFDQAARAHPSPHPGKRRANVEGDAGLFAWVDAARRILRPRGMLWMVHRADRLDHAVAAVTGRFGDIVLVPLWPRAGEPARRILLGARLGSRGAARLLPGLVLHEADGRFTAAAEAILRHGAALSMPGLDLSGG